MKYITCKELREIYNTNNTNENLSFITFYGRIRQMNWSIDKALTYPVKLAGKRLKQHKLEKRDENIQFLAF